MDLVLVVTLLLSLLGLIVLGGGVWLLYRIAWNRGFDEGRAEAIPMGGSCGGCGYEFEAGTVAEAMDRIVKHECPAADSEQ